MKEKSTSMKKKSNSMKKKSRRSKKWWTTTTTPEDTRESTESDAGSSYHVVVTGLFVLWALRLPLVFPLICLSEVAKTRPHPRTFHLCASVPFLVHLHEFQMMQDSLQICQP